MRKILWYSICDEKFIPRAYSMFNSLKTSDYDEKCLITTDEISDSHKEEFEILGVRVRNLNEIIDKGTLNSINTREKLSFLWTLPALVMKEFLNENSKYTDICYLDADLFFYNKIDHVLNAIPEGNLAIVPHRFSPRLKKYFKDSGKFNVSLVFLPVNDLGKKCGTRWAQQVKESCPIIPYYKNGKLIYGDQGYLDEWPDIYSENLTILDSPGIGLAPWNLQKYYYTFSNEILVDGNPLVFYHFSSHQYGFFFAKKIGSVYKGKGRIPNKIYKIYETDLKKTLKILKIKKWRSRYRPFLIRAIDYVKRHRVSLNTIQL